MTLFHAPAPAILVSQPRSSLDPASCAAVNGLLKELKTLSQRLRTAMTRQEEEMQILERLYYKGKNQHRAALFWKRVVEIRRYCRRLDGLQILDVVERLRYSFFDEVARQSAKTLKGSWTHIPDAGLVSYVMERLSACRVLVEKMQGRLLTAYQSLKSALQSGAFIQLIILLMAIASRMHHFTADIHETLVFGQSACQRTLRTLNPKSNTSAGSSLYEEAVTIPTTGHVSDPMISAELAHADVIYENIGQSVRCPTPRTEDAQIKASSVGHEPRALDTQAHVDADFGLDRMVILRQIGDGPSGPRYSSRTFVSPGSGLHSSRNSEKVVESSVKKKRTRKRDAIDAIFGD